MPEPINRNQGIMATRITFNDELAHYGIKGMRWGVRNSRPEGVSRSTNRAAKKDAKEFTRAKMYYGEGAGNRRKLIKAKVNQRSKDPSYKKAFDHHVANTDWEKRGKEARSKRARANVAKGTGKAARGAKNVALGNYRNVGVGILATAALFKGGQALGVIPANSVIKDRATATGRSVYNKVRKTSIDGIRSAARWGAERERKKNSQSSAGRANFSPQYRDFYDALRDAGIKI